jgi:2-oxoglutarate ferredoxin oxidoreductase subunit delta
MAKMGPIGKVTFNEDVCKGCGLCMEACPKHIIQFSDKLNLKGYHFATVSDEAMDECIACTFCAIMCPDVAIEVSLSQ